MTAYRIVLRQVGAADTADAFAVDEGRLREVSFFEAVDWELDSPVRFRVQRPLAGRTDAPLVSLSVPLFSRRVADALLDLGGFEAILYDVQLVDADDRPVGGADDFVVFHVQTFVDAIDVEAPGVEVLRRPGSSFDGTIRVHEPALVQPPAGLPTCFQVEDAERFGPFANEAGKAALERLGPVGFELVEVPTRVGG